MSSPANEFPPSTGAQLSHQQIADLWSESFKRAERRGQVDAESAFTASQYIGLSIRAATSATETSAADQMRTLQSQLNAYFEGEGQE